MDTTDPNHPHPNQEKERQNYCDDFNKMNPDIIEHPKFIEIDTTAKLPT